MPGLRSPARDEARAIAAQAGPVLVAQLAAMGMMVIDTWLLGHYAATDLAAAAVGEGLYIAVLLALAGVLQALGPIAAHHVGAGRLPDAVAALRQGFWLALALAIPGVLLLVYPDPLLALSTLSPVVEAKVRSLLRVLAWGLPVALGYRTFYSFCNAIGRPRPLMLISLATTALHAPLAWLLVYGHLGGAPLGVVGCGVSTLIVGVLAAALALVWLQRGAGVRALAIFARWAAPQPAAWREFLRLGLPIGVSNFVEISAFTFIALFVAPFGAEAVAGHRIIANLAAIAYMLPLSIAIATLARVGQAAGAGDGARLRAAASVGAWLAGGLSTLLGLALFGLAPTLVGLFTADAAVTAIALTLVGYLAVYQFFDAVQTVAAYALRALKVTLLPLLAQVFCFWGIGLGGGIWLARHGLPWRPGEMGAAGFWLAAALGLVAAAAILRTMLRRVLAVKA